ncbi:hypothetical protein IHE44_0000274 [Lamprotornis superbus]|uniref:26S proteasome complex subunit SEM1 n=1 Tax=Lamprotornis superbus TaxID=245042 RepID=A0A835P423_9PASS|nr:hypothetical protein IHE44_0000274 [Lamprotornis superbus]
MCTDILNKEDWTGLDEDEDAHVWEDNWDDDNVEDDFSNQLRFWLPNVIYNKLQDNRGGFVTVLPTTLCESSALKPSVSTTFPQDQVPMCRLPQQSKREMSENSFLSQTFFLKAPVLQKGLQPQRKSSDWDLEDFQKHLYKTQFNGKC